MMKCEIIDTGKGLAQDNMDFDSMVFKGLYARDLPVLHLYQWHYPAMTYGYFIRKEEFFRQDTKSKGWDIGRRPTGGGIVFHDGDLAFSFFVPAKHPQFSREVLKNYQFVNFCVASVLKDFFDKKIDLISQDMIPEHHVSTHFCMAKITRYDVVLNGKKVGGAAQRMNKHGFLHQGSIFLSGPSQRKLYEIFQPEIAEILAEDMRRNSFFSLGFDVESGILEEARDDLTQRLISKLFEKL